MIERINNEIKDYMGNNPHNDFSLYIVSNMFEVIKENIIAHKDTLKSKSH